MFFKTTLTILFIKDSGNTSFSLSISLFEEEFSVVNIKLMDLDLFFGILIVQKCQNLTTSLTYSISHFSMSIGFISSIQVIIGGSFFICGRFFDLKLLINRLFITGRKCQKVQLLLLFLSIFKLLVF